MRNYVFYVYILKCYDVSYYTGVTNNLEKRFSEHVEGVNSACYTYNKRPLRLVYFEEFTDISFAIAREKQLKGWSRKKKEALINENYDKLKEYSKSSSKKKIDDASASSE